MKKYILLSLLIIPLIVLAGGSHNHENHQDHNPPPSSPPSPPSVPPPAPAPSPSTPPSTQPSPSPTPSSPTEPSSPPSGGGGGGGEVSGGGNGPIHTEPCYALPEPFLTPCKKQQIQHLQDLLNQIKGMLDNLKLQIPPELEARTTILPPTEDKTYCHEPCKE